MPANPPKAAGRGPRPRTAELAGIAIAFPVLLLLACGRAALRIAPIIVLAACLGFCLFAAAGCDSWVICSNTSGDDDCDDDDDDDDEEPPPPPATASTGGDGAGLDDCTASARKATAEPGGKILRVHGSPAKEAKAPAALTPLRRDRSPVRKMMPRRR